MVKKVILKYKKLIHIAIILLVSLILGNRLFFSNLDVFYDDGIQHIARAYGTFESYKQNGIFSRVIFNFANKFGYSWDLFYGFFTTLGIIAINLLFNNYIVSYKIFTGIMLFLSGLTMYKLVKEITQNGDAALLSSVLYMAFPYHLTDLYSRNALGEFTSFVFIPLVFLGLYNIFNSNKNPYYLALGAIGLIITHNLSTLLVLIFAVFYLIMNIKRLKDINVIKKLFINLIFILFITSFYWAPLIETIIFSDYHAYQSGAMSTSTATGNNGLSITQLFVTKNDGSYVFELGLQTIIILGLSIMAFRIINDKFKKTYDFFLIVSILCLWMSTRYFPWKILPEAFSIIQFPWRFLQIAAISLSVVCSINMLTLIKKFNLKDSIIISCIAVFYVLSLARIQVHTEDILDINNYRLGEISGSVNEVVAGIAREEYLPERAYNNRFYIATREDATYVLAGKAIIENEEKYGGTYTANIQTFDADYTAFELPYLYYPGYEIRVDGMLKDSFETENGFIGFILGKDDKVSLEVRYTGTIIMKVTAVISILSTIIFVVIFYKNRVNKRKEVEDV